MAQQRASNGAGSAARHVEQIVQAAEQTAEELRAAAEARANERIAEAERAAELRVRAAEEEAAEVRAAAEAQAREAIDEAEIAAQDARAEAEAAAREAQDKAAKGARELLYEARIATREVLRDGETLSGHLRELSDSLRVNAERLLLDIRAAHAEMTARLDRVDPDVGGQPGRLDRDRPAAAPSSSDPDVPEFIPRRPR
ncbi:MAG: hypothetical protein Q8K79_14920 [Solirubrobacteraceae bacterium]|nr:hypothetical protein [Solirubrobacteraceae bacterium]